MDETIKEIYRQIILNSNYRNDLNKITEIEIESLYKEEWGDLEINEFEAQRDKAYQVATIAEENGFIKGFQYAVKLFIGI